MMVVHMQQATVRLYQSHERFAVLACRVNVAVTHGSTGASYGIGEIFM